MPVLPYLLLSEVRENLDPVGLLLSGACSTMGPFTGPL